MTKEQQYFLHLVSSHLNNTTPEAPIDIDLSELFEVCELQNMTALAAIELKKLLKNGAIIKEQFSPFNQVLGLTIQNYEYKTEAIEQLKKVLGENNIKHLFLKGAAIRKLYPVPEVRTSGDTDVVVSAEDFDRATSLLTHNSFRLVESTEKDNVLYYRKEQFELKPRIEYINDAIKTYFEDTFDENKCISSGGSTYELKPLYHLVYISYHALKHITGGGIGVRQLADIDIMLRKTDIDINAYFEICKALGLEKSCKSLVALTKYYFNTPVYADININPELRDSLSEVILNGGPFGFNNSKGTTRLYNTMAKSGNADKSITLKALLSLFIVESKTLYNSYQYAESHHILLPVAYFNRLFDAVFKRGRDNVKNIKSILSEREFAKSIGEMLSELEENK